jgi:hypothetical protein
MATCALTQGFTLDCIGDNAGGIVEIYITELNNKATLTDASGAITAFTLAQGKQFYKYELYAEQGEATEEQVKKTENGTIGNTQSVKIPLYKQDVAKRNELYLVAKNRVMVIVRSSNDDYWLYGKTYGMNLTSRAGVFGKLIDDKNGYDLTFEGKEPLPASKINSALIPTLLLPAV